MADLLSEVDEVMRQERLEKFWKENRNYIIGVILGTILLTAAISGYRSWTNSVKERQTAHLITLQTAEDYPDNILASDDLDLSSDLRGIALMQAAGRFIQQDKKEEAQTVYDRAASDKAIPAEFRYLGAIMSVRLLIDKEDSDGKALLTKLAPALKDKKSPWQNHARIEAAVISAEKLSDYEAALGYLNAVKAAEGLPESITSRANALAHLYALKNKGKSETGS